MERATSIHLFPSIIIRDWINTTGRRKHLRYPYTTNDNKEHVAMAMSITMATESLYLLHTLRTVMGLWMMESLDDDMGHGLHH
jgi:hypothetical protein